MGEWRYSTMYFNLTLYGGEWLASCPGCCTPGERALVTHWIGGWVGPRTSLNTIVKRKNPHPARS